MRTPHVPRAAPASAGSDPQADCSGRNDCQLTAETHNGQVSWRDVLPVHPAADMFPMMEREELLALGEDILKNGLQSPIALWSPKEGEPDLLLDGRNRLDAMEAVGFKLVGFKMVGIGEHAEKPTLAEWSVPHTSDGRALQIRCRVIHCWVDHHYGLRELHAVTGGGIGKCKPKPDCDPYAFAVSANIHRRHLSSEQKRNLIEKLLIATPEKSDRQIAAMAKVDHKTVGTVRKEAEGRGEIPHVDNHTDTRGREQPVKRRVERHVCWQCGERDTVDNLHKRHCPEFEDADVWLHANCVDAFEQGRAAKKAAAAADETQVEDDNDLEEGAVADPAVIEDNILYGLRRADENFRAYCKIVKISALDQAAVARIDFAVATTIKKLRALQAALAKKAAADGGAS